MVQYRVFRDLFAIFSVVMLIGCSGGGKPEIANRIPCRGTVTFDGKPLDHGTVGFSPVDENVGRFAVGKIKNGRFQMETTSTSPGVVTGKYRVRVESLEDSPLGPDGMPTGVAKNLLPTKYGDFKTSGLEVEVTKRTGPVVLDLKKE